MAEKRFIKGLFKDTGHIDQPEGSWRHARNMVINETEGAVSNEGGTELSGFLGTAIGTGSQMFKVVGKIEVDNDRVVLFSTDIDPAATDPHSEIGIWEKGVYTPLFNPLITAPGKATNDLQFREAYPIEGTFKISSTGDLIVYWTDDFNPPRAFNIDRQIRESTWKEDLYTIPSNLIDNIDLLNLFPYSGPVPHIDVNDQGTHQGCIIEGGGLLTGVYYLALAYVDEDLVATNFLTVSNPIPIVEEFDSTIPTNKKDGAREGSQTTKAIKWDISNLNTNYQYIRPVVVRSKGEAREAYRLNDIDFTTNTKSVIFSGLETTATGSVEEVIIDTISYDTAKTIQQLDDVLYLGNTTGSKDVGYQKYANNITLKSRIKTFSSFDQFYASVDNIQTGWGSRPVNDFGGTVQSVDHTKSYRYIPNIFKWKGYMRDEIYAFYIAFILKDGSMSYAYHIPGRVDIGDEKLSVDTLQGNAYGGLWDDIYNISPEYGKRFHWIDYRHPGIHLNTSNNTNLGGGTTYSLGNSKGMNYWENATEYYPDTDNYDIWNKNGDTGETLKGLNVRHHHFPSNINPDRKSIFEEHGCETTVSTGSDGASLPQWDGVIAFEYTGNGGVGEINDTTWTRYRFDSGYNNQHLCPNDPAMAAALWHGTPGTQRFVADQEMKVAVSWEVWFHESWNAPGVETYCRIQPADGGAPIDINFDTIGSGSFGSGVCGGGWDDANVKHTWSAFHTLNAGDEIYIESKEDGSSGGSPDQPDMGGNIGQYPGSLANSQPGGYWPNNLGCASITDTCLNSGTKYLGLAYIGFKVKPVETPPPPNKVMDAKISHAVRALGFDLYDIHIPQSIADKIQGFRIYYAKRKHSDRTVLGQSIALPAKRKSARLGICTEADSQEGSAQVLSTLQNLPEAFYSLDPYPDTWSTYETLSIFSEQGGLSDPVGAAFDGPAHNVFSFHDFYLLRTKNSLASATHMSIQYYVKNLAWNGPGIDQDKKMVTELRIPDPGTSGELEPIEVREIWGWDADQNCYPQKMRSGIFIGCDYIRPSDRTMPRLLGQKAKTYLLGDTIFKGDSLGFGGKLFNEFGESCITFKLMDNHAIDALRVQNNPLSSFSGGTFGGSSTPEYGRIGRTHTGNALLTNHLNASGDFVNNGGGKSMVAMVNLKAFKTDVYKSIDSQELVWTGFEVLGDDLENFVFDEGGNLGGTGSTLTTHPDGIFGGDTFLCRYGVTASLKPSNVTETSEPKKAIHYHIVESTDNINFRHQEDDDSFYFPNGVAKEILREAGPKDFNHFDNMKYNDNYSENNDIRPAFPLPLRDTIQDDFPTRTHRSAKHDTTSIIDNYRIFLANQFRDLPKNRGDLWKLASFSNTLYFHMEESLFAAQGKQTMQMGDGSEAFVGSGDIFQQEPNEVIQTEGGFGGTASQWACLTTRYGYFFVDKVSKKVFMMKDQLLEISNLGMEKWFQDNLRFKLEDYEFTSKCNLDNPIQGMGYTAIYDPKFKRIILTKREFVPTQAFIDGWNATGNTTSCTAYPDDKIRFDNTKCLYERWGRKKDGTCGWTKLVFACNSSYFNCEGWTISYYPEMGVWGSFHDYVPYIYFNTSTDFYSLTDKYIRPVWVQGTTNLAMHSGTTYGNAGIWKHNSGSNYGRLYKEWSFLPANITYEEWLDVDNGLLDHQPFEFEFIHNEFKAEDTLLSSFNYTLETFNQRGISVLQHGFTSFFIYNTFQISSESNLEYFINIRRVGNNWKVNKFRDMSATENQAGVLNAPNTTDYYTSANVNIIGGTNTGTLTTSNIATMFLIDGMSKTSNPAYLDTTKNWTLQRKFIDKWAGIRLIYNNISNNLLNLYSTDIGVRKMYR